jgi:hypothetical protein
MNHQRLKTRQRAERGGWPLDLGLRVHRALSWLDRAERAGKELQGTGKERRKASEALKDADLDAQFIFLWIAFNAAYATEIDERYQLSEQANFRNFLGQLLPLDTGGKIAALLWTEFPQSIRLLLDNPYVFKDFWAWKHGHITEEQWRRKFSRKKHEAHAALAGQDTMRVLSIVLSRIYTLRNQLIHGGATWNSGVNREQLRDCARLMGKLVPLVIEIMMDNPESLWGEACYPVVDAT